MAQNKGRKGIMKWIKMLKRIEKTTRDIVLFKRVRKEKQRLRKELKKR